ncbi:MAG: hypothetical protein KF874_10365 [Rhizobiaceae bacterium]|nr:hypothetical protein [Rhizobiaceae bacterium]
MDTVTEIATIECPYCAEVINAKSKKCKHCGEILDHQMREIEMLKRQAGGPHVFMNAGGASAAGGGGGGASSSAAAAVGSAAADLGLRRFPHWIHILVTLLTTGLWLPGYLLMYWFRNKRYYY